MDKKKFEEMSKDPSFTMEVKNPEVEEMLVEYSKDNSAENLNKLINKITKCRFFSTCKCKRTETANAACYKKQ